MIESPPPRPGADARTEPRLSKLFPGDDGLIRSILETRWDNKTWPTAKATLKQALEAKKKIRRAGVVLVIPPTMKM